MLNGRFNARQSNRRTLYDRTLGVANNAVDSRRRHLGYRRAGAHQDEQAEETCCAHAGNQASGPSREILRTVLHG